MIKNAEILQPLFGKFDIMPHNSNHRFEVHGPLLCKPTNWHQAALIARTFDNHIMHCTKYQCIIMMMMMMKVQYGNEAQIGSIW